MLSLSLDTSTQYSVVAISSKNQVLSGAKRLFEKRRTDKLVGLIDSCLKRAKCDLKDIDGFGVGLGPGSFTGLRIGLSTVKAFGYALRKPCVVFSSLDAVAFNAAHLVKNELCVAVDARRSNVYCRFYKKSDRSSESSRGICGISLDLLLPLSAFLDRLSADVVVCGDAIATYGKDMEARGRGVRLAPEKLWFPSPESIAFLAKENFKIKMTVDCSKINPVYLYEQDCQVRPMQISKTKD